jgi:hypothetical protein
MIMARHILTSRGYNPDITTLRNISLQQMILQIYAVKQLGMREASE